MWLPDKVDCSYPVAENTCKQKRSRYGFSYLMGLSFFTGVEFLQQLIKLDLKKLTDW